MLWAGHVIDRHHRARIVAVCLAAQVVALWLRLFPGLAQRDGLVQAPGDDTRY